MPARRRWDSRVRGVFQPQAKEDKADEGREGDQGRQGDGARTRRTPRTPSATRTKPATTPKPPAAAAAQGRQHARAGAGKMMAAPAPMSTLAVEALNKRYKSRVVVHDVSLTVGSGEVDRPARPERRRQDDLLLHDRRPGRDRRRSHRARRRGPDAHADSRAGAPGLVVPAAGGVDLPQAVGGGERAGDPRAAGHRHRRNRQPPGRAARGSVDLASARQCRR